MTPLLLGGEARGGGYKHGRNGSLFLKINRLFLKINRFFLKINRFLCHDKSLLFFKNSLLNNKRYAFQPSGDEQVRYLDTYNSDSPHW